MANPKKVVSKGTRAVQKELVKLATLMLKQKGYKSNGSPKGK